MHVGNLIAAASAILPCLIEAHGSGVPGAPRLFGRRSALQIEHGSFVKERSLAHKEDLREHAHFVRQATSANTDGQCGPSYGSCAQGYCCSQAGWCGMGTEYCESPGCQFNYGPACDDNTVPPGSNTSTIARPKVGNVPYGGAGIYDCTIAGTIALTFDDGPYIYTDYILDVLKNYSARATFFVTGNNNGKGEIDNAANGWSTIIQRAYNEGHQIASHTWTHPYLSNLTSAQRKQQMWSNEMALRNILGFFPTYMRPPYSDCTAASGCQKDMADLGYHITYFDVDTDDYDNDSPTLIQNAKNNFNNGIAGGEPANSDYLVIGHDIHNQTAHNLTAYMLQTLLAQGYKPVTVGECLGDPEENWYRNSTGSVFTSSTSVAPTSTSTAATISATGISIDATCGGSTGFTCAGSTFGNCCSASGWCGSGDTYCGEGCQAGFGSCGINVSQSSSSISTAVVAAVSATAVSSDATCGGSTGFTCQGSSFGNCCSVHGFCGSTDAYCGTGCQSGFGSCGSSNSLSAASTSISSAASSAMSTAEDVATTSAASKSTSQKNPSTSSAPVTIKATTSNAPSKTSSQPAKATSASTAKTTLPVRPFFSYRDPPF